MKNRYKFYTQGYTPARPSGQRGVAWLMPAGAQDVPGQGEADDLANMFSSPPPATANVANLDAFAEATQATVERFFDRLEKVLGSFLVQLGEVLSRPQVIVLRNEPQTVTIDHDDGTTTTVRKG
jgi:hypothetical protein